MKGKLSTGIWFVFFGTIILLHNFDIINFNFWAILPYWPLLIIAIGAKLIFQQRPHGTMILAAINLALCLFLSYIGMTSKTRNALADSINFYSHTEQQDSLGSKIDVSFPYTANTEKANLEFHVGASSIALDAEPTEQLIEAYSNNENMGLKLESTGDSTAPKLELHAIVKNNNSNRNHVNLKLNSQPIWAISMNMGAASFNGDFTPYKIDRLAINAGAASLKMTVGMPVSHESLIEINSAASSCKLSIPKDAACRLEMESILSSKKFDGFNKKDNAQQTDNYDTADRRYLIKVTGAANSLKITRY